MKFEDLSGRTFGRLTVVRRVANSRSGQTKFECICECGATTTVQSGNLKTGHIKSCGCLSRDTTSKLNSTHGMTGTRTYRIWYNLKNRIFNPNIDSYKYYGGRGIKMDPRWLVFETFIADMGECPEGLSIERIHNDGHYTPGNCKWATKKEQANNTRTNRFLTYQGKTKTVAQWAEDLGVSPFLIYQRLDRLSWAVARALTQPAQRQSGRNT